MIYFHLFYDYLAIFFVRRQILSNHQQYFYFISRESMKNGGGQVSPEFTTKNQSFPKMTMKNCGNIVRGCDNTVKQNA